MELEEAISRARVRSVELPTLAIRRAVRVGVGMTQADLAEVVGVERPSVSRWESGSRDPRGALRVRYAEILDTLANTPRTKPKALVTPDAPQPRKGGRHDRD